MQGLICIDKPAGWTSFDVVNYIRRMVAQAEQKKPKQIKVGHTGTLDPFATGVLVVLVGKDYTRKAGKLSKVDKVYEVTAKLGNISTTGDPEGEISHYSGKVATEEEAQDVLEKFKGKIEQTPPAYSAIKINGQRAYKLARAGKEVKIEPRQVTINKLEITKYEYPDVILHADVSSGTYIRALVEDIGEALHTGAYTTQLRRLKVGDYGIDQAHQLSELNGEALQSLLRDPNVESP